MGSLAYGIELLFWIGGLLVFGLPLVMTVLQLTLTLVGILVSGLLSLFDRRH